MSAAAADQPEEPQITPRRVAAFLVMVFGMFMAILDIQIVSASLPEIQAGLGASADEISWVQTSYLIAEVVMIPLSGLLGRMMSTRYLFAASAAGFTAASLDLSRNCSAPLTWYFATKEKHHGTETDPGISRRGSAGRIDQRPAA